MSDSPAPVAAADASPPLESQPATSTPADAKVAEATAAAEVATVASEETQAAQQISMADPPVIEGAAVASPAVLSPAVSTDLDAIIARVHENFETCEGMVAQAVLLRRQVRKLRESLPGIATEAERVHVSDEADSLMRRACVIEDRLPGLLEGVGQMMIDQIKVMADRPE